MNIEKTQKRAARGAGLLDAAMPGWAGSVDRAMLNMQYCDVCVLGQTYPDMSFTGALNTVMGDLPYDGDNIARYGFDVKPEHYGKDDFYERFEVLTRAWLSEIEARRSL